jgi:signal transduction histidine kinase
MNAKLDPVAETGLQFFGKMAASISHEIKNILAVVNENAGLLEDLAHMGDQGALIEPQRLKQMSKVVMKQVGRADAIVKNMNRLAHSVDESNKIVDLNDVLELLVAVSSRFASARGVALQPEDGQNPMQLKTFPLFLMALFWLCLDYAMDAAGEDKTVELVARKTEAGTRVFFKGLGGLAGVPLKPFPAEAEKGLCDLLGAGLEVSAENQEITVSFATDRDGE